MIISKRHKRTPLRTKVVRKIEDIPASDWNRVYPDIMESYDFFRSVDDSCLEQFSFYYLMVYERNTPVAATTFFLATIEGNVIPPCVVSPTTTFLSDTTG